MRWFISILMILFFLSAVYSIDLNQLTLTKNIKEYKLDNGLRVIIKEENSVPLVGFSVTYQVGFRNDDPGGRTGLTHLLEHMMFKGTKKLKKGEIARTLRDAGARFNAFTGYDKTCYWEVMPKGAFETAVQIEADRMENSQLDPKEFESEKNVVLSEITKYESNPQSKLERKLYQSLLGDHPYAQMYGKIEDMKKADRDYVYDKLYKKYYCPNNAYIVVAGNIKANDALGLIKKYFGSIPRNNKLIQEKIQSIPFKKDVDVFVTGAASEDFGETLFRLPVRDLNNRDFLVLSFINQADIIGGFEFDATPDGGIGAVRFSGDADYPAETIDTNYIIQNFNIFQSRFFHQELLGYDSVQSIMMNLVYYERFSGYKGYDKMMAAFEKIKPGDVIQVIKKYLAKENSGKGFFKAAKKDAAAEPESTAQTSENFGNDIDFSDLENPTAEDIKKTEAVGKAVFKDAEVSVKKYLSDVKEIKLDNGLTVIFKPYTMNQKVSVAVGIKAGSIFQKKPQTAEWTWDLVFGGGPQIKLKNELENNGAVFRGGVDMNYSGFEMEFPVSQLEKALDMLSVSLKDRNFIPLVLEEKKFNAVKFLSEKDSNPDASFHADFELKKMLFGKRGLGLDYFAQKADITEIALSDIDDYYISFYRPENTVIVIVGNMDFDKTLKKIKNTLGEWGQKKAVLPMDVPPLEKPARNTYHKIKLPVYQSLVMMGAPSADYADLTNYVATSLANQIFGGGVLTSRLIRVIRDKHGLTYAVFTYLTPYADRSIFNLYMQNAGKDVEKALSLFWEELKNFKKEGPNDLEIAKFKNSLLSSVVFNYQNGSSIASELLYFKMRRNDYRGDEKFIDVLYQMDKNRILKAVQDNFPENYFISIAGD